MSLEEICVLWKNIEHDISQSRLKKTKRSGILISIAVSVVILLTCGLAFYHYHTVLSGQSDEQMEYVDIPIPKNIQLVLGDKEVISMEGKEAQIIYNEEGLGINNQQVRLNNKQEHSKKQAAFNQLIVPFGKRSMITFDDLDLVLT